jgi:indoleamine 2,3-dioxygenase
MPRKHRQFLEEVSKLPTIRSIVERYPQDAELTQAYNGCMKQLRTWRSTHIAIVSKYIITPARRSEQELLGTAGSALVPFLRQTRDETVGISVAK